MLLSSNLQKDQVSKTNRKVPEKVWIVKEFQTEVASCWGAFTCERPLTRQSCRYVGQTGESSWLAESGTAPSNGSMPGNAANYNIG